MSNPIIGMGPSVVIMTMESVVSATATARTIALAVAAPAMLLSNMAGAAMAVAKHSVFLKTHQAPVPAPSRLAASPPHRVRRAYKRFWRLSAPRHPLGHLRAGSRAGNRPIG